METFPRFPLIILDDQLRSKTALKLSLTSHGFTNLVFCDTVSEFLAQLQNQEISLPLVQAPPRPAVLHQLDTFFSTHPELPFLYICNQADIDNAVNLLKQSSYLILNRPYSEPLLIKMANHLLTLAELNAENQSMRENILRKPSKKVNAFSDIITQNSKMQALFQYSEAIASSQQPILITGETGVGKELFAKALHALSNVHGKFIPVNIAGLDSNVFADTLFGHVKGAFTGALASRKGLIEEAADGTLFLDEIGDLSQDSQLKLLRLLEEHEYLPIGSDVTMHSNARIIVATNRNLSEHIKSNAFRKDLYYRLHTHHIHIPPLRERLDDLAPLINHFVFEASTLLGKKTPTYPKELIMLLKNHLFPGNVRELRSLIFDAITQHQDRILSLQVFRDHIHQALTHSQTGMDDDQHTTTNPFSQLQTLPFLSNVAELLVEEAMRRTNGNQKMAAVLLGVSQQALNYRVKKLRKHH